MALVEDMFRRFMERQHSFFNKLTKSQKRHLAEDYENRYAELRVTGPEGGLFYFRYRGQRFEMLDGRPSVPREELDELLLDGDIVNYDGGDEVFFDVIDGDLSPRAVISRKYFRVNSDRIIYDTEEFAQAFEQFLEELRAVLGRGRH